MESSKLEETLKVIQSRQAPSTATVTPKQTHPAPDTS